MNDPLRYTDPTGHGAGAVAADAMFNTETIKSSYTLMTMHDTFAQKLWEVPVASVGIVAGGADAVFNMMTLGGKGVVEGGIKEGIKAGVKATAESAAKDVAKDTAKTTSKEGEKLFRGVPAGDTEKATLGRQGVAKPRGTALDEESLKLHVKGKEVNAGVTSWTTDRSIAAKRFAGSDGTVIEANKSDVADKIVSRPNVGKYTDEKEVLLKGTIQGKPTTP